MSKNQNIVCYCNELEKFYFSPTFILGYDFSDFLNMYAFISVSPDTPEGDFLLQEKKSSVTYVKKVMKNIIFMKKIDINDLSPVAERIDWTNNTFYDAFDPELNMSERDSEGKLIRKFYVRNKYDQIFKCLWNNVNKTDTYSVSSIVNSNSYYSINHSGPSFDVGSYITIQDSDPNEYNVKLKVNDSALGVANVSSGIERFNLNVTSGYSANAIIKQTILTSEEPYFDVGTFDESYIITTADGYKWKYIFTLNKQSKSKFFDYEWMPVPVQANFKNPLNTTSGFGSIDVINVVDGGSGYENGTNTVNVIISGDGKGASAEAYVANNSIQQVIVTNPGYDYISANVSITPSSGYSGSGAEVVPNISIIGGHGINFVRDLFCRNIMITGSFIESENGKLATDISFNQVGIMYNPYLVSDLTNQANSSYIDCTTEIILSPGDQQFSYGETIYQGTSLPENVYSARVVSYNVANNSLKVINTSGDIQLNYEIIGNTSNVKRVVRQENKPSYVTNSGNLFYLENRTEIERNQLGTEQIRILVKYN